MGAKARGCLLLPSQQQLSSGHEMTARPYGHAVQRPGGCGTSRKAQGGPTTKKGLARCHGSCQP